MIKGLLSSFFVVVIIAIAGTGLYISRASAAGNPAYFTADYCIYCKFSDPTMLNLAKAGKIDFYENINGVSNKFNSTTGKFEPADVPAGTPEMTPAFQDPVNPANNFTGKPSQQKLDSITSDLAKRETPNDVICIVPRPGQNEDYGPLTDKPFPPEGQIRDTEAVHPIDEGHIADE
ncbi:MAG: hypothetical protein K8Q97_02460, partial [Candidatus Andersenbacteria bacterium]|nr:hypothetical protein [Candidatus Andersenbacteria bacterium]